MNGTDSKAPCDLLGVLKARDELYSLAVTAGAVGVWEWHPKTACFMAHPVLLAMLGYDPLRAVLPLREWLMHVHARDRERVQQAMSQFLASDSPLYEHCHRMIDCRGRARRILSRGIVAERERSSPIRVVGTDIDVTDAFKSVPR